MFIPKIIQNEFRSRMSIISLVVSGFALVMMVLALNESTLPLLTNFGNAFLVLWILGFSLSILAGLCDNPEGEFTIPKPVMLPLMMFGVLVFLLLVLVFFPVLFLIINSPSDIFLLLLLLVVSKWILAHLYTIQLLSYEN
jgi:hypothetical protein